jgi:hypothetical protein
MSLRRYKEGHYTKEQNAQDGRNLYSFKHYFPRRRLQTRQTLRLALRLEMDGTERMCVWANRCLGLRNPANYRVISVTFQGFVEIDARRNLGIHCHEAKQEISP